MFGFTSKVFHLHTMLSITLKSIILLLLVWSSNIDEYRVQARESSLLGYYLQLYNSINSYRAKHTIPALKWNRTLTDSAEYYAMRLLSAPESFDIEASEGLTLFVTPGTIRPSAAYVTGIWYNESALYNFNNPGYNPTCLNFTQMIWKSSTAVGIGSYTDHNYTSVVAKFYPAGNIKGSYRQNVVPKYKKM